MAASVDFFTTSTSAKRTSTRPSGSGCIEPTTTASAPRARQASGCTSSAFTGRGTTASGLTILNIPERLRSAATTPEMPSGNADSPANGTIAMGMAVPAPPTISMVSCARAAANGKARKARRTATRRNERCMPGISLVSRLLKGVDGSPSSASFRSEARNLLFAFD